MIFLYTKLQLDLDIIIWGHVSNCRPFQPSTTACSSLCYNSSSMLWVEFEDCIEAMEELFTSFLSVLNVLRCPCWVLRLLHQNRSPWVQICGRDMSYSIVQFRGNSGWWNLTFCCTYCIYNTPCGTGVRLLFLPLRHRRICRTSGILVLLGPWRASWDVVVVVVQAFTGTKL